MIHNGWFIDLMMERMGELKGTISKFARINLHMLTWYTKSSYKSMQYV